MRLMVVSQKNEKKRMEKDGKTDENDLETLVNRSQLKNDSYAAKLFDMGCQSDEDFDRLMSHIARVESVHKEEVENRLCATYRGTHRVDVFYQGQRLYYIFCDEITKELKLKVKEHGSHQWIDFVPKEYYSYNLE